jgi:large subunit ribosomal protein L29
MKKDSLKGLDPAELEQKLQEIGEQQFRIKFQMSMGQTEGLKKLREMRKNKARILTWQREKAIQAARNQAATNQVSTNQGATK